MNRPLRGGVSLLASMALVSSLLAVPGSAYASTDISNSVDESTNWTVPDTYMDNTVEVDGTLYKVITTWANAWALSGPDYVGVSNSGVMNQSGGSGGTSDLVTAQTTTMLGIWASSVNEVPNAYNWNYFYNLALQDSGGEVDSTQVAAVDVQNGASADYDTASGVYACFKYRPEVIWTSNSLSSTQVATYVAEINSLDYYTDGEQVEDGASSEYYIDGDEDYDPYIVDTQRDSNLAHLDSLYELAGYCELIEAETADYNSDGAVTEDNVTWKTMNNLPRTTRYEASSENAVSARECALDVEKLLKGAVYYTLAKIADGTTEKKTVAVVSGTIDTTSATATVVDYEGDYEGTRGDSSGKIGVAALAIDCLTTETEATATSSSDGGGMGGGGGGMGGGTGGGGMGGGTTSTGASYSATADELLEADIIWAADGSLSVEQVESWLSDNVTSEEGKDKIESIEIVTDTPAFMNGHNFTFEKSVDSLYDLSCFYPELWPDLELVSYWYDNVYHVNYDDLSVCLQYGLGNATMPSGVEINDLPGDSYSNNDIDAKAIEGYEYYVSDLAGQSPYADDELLQPTETYAAWATGTEVCPDGHSFKMETTAPTCTEAGYTTYTCTECGFTYTDEDAAATGHSNLLAAEAASLCMTVGAEVYQCTVCGAVTVETIETSGFGSSAAFVWGSDYTATFVTADAGVSAIAADVTYVVASEATGSSSGVGIYVASVRVGGVTYTDARSVIIAATGDASADGDQTASDSGEGQEAPEGDGQAAEGGEGQSAPGGDGQSAPEGDGQAAAEGEGTAAEG